MIVHYTGNINKAYLILLTLSGVLPEMLVLRVKLDASRKIKHDCLDFCFSQNLLRVLGALASYSSCSVRVGSLLAHAVYFHFSSSYRNTKLTFRWVGSCCIFVLAENIFRTRWVQFGIMSAQHLSAKCCIDINIKISHLFYFKFHRDSQQGQLLCDLLFELLIWFVS